MKKGYLGFANFFQTSMINRKNIYKAKTVVIEGGCLAAFICLVYE